jgi:tripartite-type tricarboxylate transporter receptor subunit TctC
MTSCRALAALLVAVSSALLASNPARAQSYPDHPVKIIVPIGPAGSYDLVGRVLADSLTKRLGQSVVVENRPGAGTIVGTQAVVNAPPDGYTLLVGGLSNIVFNAGLYKKLSYDPLGDLVPVALVLNISYTLIGAKDLPYASPKEVIEAAKKNPGGLKLANAGVGTGQHLLGAAFMKITGTKMLEVPYRGCIAALRRYSRTCSAAASISSSTPRRRRCRTSRAARPRAWPSWRPGATRKFRTFRR